MNTDELISLMAAGHRAVDTGWLRRATWLAGGLGLAVTVALVLLMLGTRADLGQAWLSVPVLAKLLLGASVAGISLALFQMSLRPGLKPARRLPLLALPLITVAAWAVWVLAQAPVAQWHALTWGRSWYACLGAVSIFALGPLAILLALARRGAPVERALTGACAGLTSAGLAIVAYALHCPEDSAPFVAAWYTLGIAIVTLLGTFGFSRLLRW
jgi:hypothetical protein